MTIYTTPTCPNCVLVKNYLDNKGVSYSTKDVSKDLEARALMIELSGGLNVPVTEHKGSCAVGFNVSAIEELLKL